MGRLAKAYIEYRKADEKYQEIRKKLFTQPEMDAHEAAMDFNIYELKRRVESLIEKYRKRAREYYSTIYKEEPTMKDIDRFLAISDELLEYPKLITAEEQTVLRLSRDLVFAYKTAFRGTQDEYDQKTLIEETGD